MKDSFVLIFFISFSFKAVDESWSSTNFKGKFHSGFLEQAELFPIDKILNEEIFSEAQVICCGHSLGGAIASVVAIKLFISLKRSFQERSIKCITFGAPLFGNKESQNFVAEQMSPNLHNFIFTNDPVPKLLQYTQSISPVVEDLDSSIAAMEYNMQGTESHSFFEEGYNALMSSMESCNVIKEVIDESMPTLTSLISATSLSEFSLSEVTDFSELFESVNTLYVTATTMMEESIYLPIGNFYFIGKDFQMNETLSCKNFKKLQIYFDDVYQKNSKGSDPTVHCLSYYIDLFELSNYYPFDRYPCTFVDEFGEYYRRKIELLNPFAPVIQSVELTKTKGGKDVLKLSLTGKYLHGVVLELCQFDFSFPFLGNKNCIELKKIPLGENIERLLLIGQMPDTAIAISDYGVRVLLVTQFGEVQTFIRRENVRNVVIDSVKQIAENDSVSLVVRRAIQRGMALMKIKNDSDHNARYDSREPIIKEINELGSIALGNDIMKKKENEMFHDLANNFYFVLSNEEAFCKVKVFCDEIEGYIRSPLHIEVTWTTRQKMAIAASVAVGAVAGLLAGPGLALIGVSSLTSLGIAIAGGALGALSMGATATTLMNEKLTESNYKNALKWILQEPFRAKENSLDEATKTNLNDLIDKDDTYSQEKATLLLATDDLLKSFKNCSIEKCTEYSKDEVRKRVKTIRSIHKIREIFSQQCFIGIVGLQDAGKTTLVKKIWGVGGKTGYFSHTDGPKLYQVTQKLLVIDFPGSNSLDYHSKTFSICGAMNNMVIVVIPYSGDISEIHSQEIAKVYGVMKGSDSTKVILCINKCCLYLKQLKEELATKEKPVEFLKQHFVGKLNHYYERSEVPVRIVKDDILFTDWELNDQSGAIDFGIVGVDKIKTVIKEYLVNYEIYKSTDVDHLERCVSDISKTLTERK